MTHLEKGYFKSYQYTIERLEEIDPTDEYEPEILLDGTLIDEQHIHLYTEADADEIDEPELIESHKLYFQAYGPYVVTNHYDYFSKWDNKRYVGDDHYLTTHYDFTRPPDLTPYRERYKELHALAKLKDQIKRMHLNQYNAEAMDILGVPRCNACFFKFINSNQYSK